MIRLVFWRDDFFGHVEYELDQVIPYFYLILLSSTLLYIKVNNFCNYFSGGWGYVFFNPSHGVC